ncbi:FAD-binding oxidoreductase [Methylocystis bryophila]|nr:FAD-binding oxidoreductase [Methylocystis bryophila]BDV39836.1 FAD-linked oxidase [Methylocystis bryophila]
MMVCEPAPFAARDDFLSWGRVVRRAQQVARPRFRGELPSLLALAPAQGVLAAGLRRSYGDSCLNTDGAAIDMRGLDRFIAFDADTGVLRAEAGVSLSQILALAVPQGWFLHTTPGTRFVTLGGALANDVHGKNHHRAGSFGCNVRSFGLLRSDGFRGEVSPSSDLGLFNATIGGLGLTGVIEWVELQLEKRPSSYLDSETIAYGCLSDFFALAKESAERYEHTVAWIDASSKGAKFGRGLFSRANWRDDDERDAHRDGGGKSIPADAPTLLLNPLSIGLFNEAYFRSGQRKAGVMRQHYAPFFYPLDAIRQWNRLYGRPGMYQYQCVVPPESAPQAIEALLAEIARSGQASFLAVLKTFGDRSSPGILSFPRPGATLALDFPNRGAKTLKLMARLDQIVIEAKGALYPAKDGRISPRLFRASFPKWETFLRHKDEAMNSDFWRRVAQ